MSGATSAMSMASAASGSGSMLGGVLQLAPSIASTVGGAMNAGSNARAAQSVATYQANIAEQNAALAELRAVDAETRGDLEVERLATRTAGLIGRQRAATGASGVLLNEGSPQAIRESTEAMRDADIAMLRNNAARSAWGHRVQEANYRADSSSRRAQADAISPSAASVTSLLGGSASVADKWYNIYKNGGFGGGSTGNKTLGPLAMGAE